MEINDRFITNVQRKLIDKVPAEQVAIVTAALVRELADYELKVKEVGLVVPDCSNELILDAYRKDLMIGGKSENTIIRYLYELGRFCKMLAEDGKRLDKVTEYDIRRYLAIKMESGSSKRTANNLRQIIYGFYSWMCMVGAMSSNPCSRIPKINYNKTKPKAFTKVDVYDLSTNCINAKEKALVECLLSSCMRVSELCNLKKSDVDMHTGEVLIREGKGGKTRYTFFSDVAMKCLREYLLTNRYESEWLFTSPRGKNNDYRYSTDGIRYILRTIAKRTSVTKVHPHRFRRTTATTLIENGANIFKVQQLLGHSSVSTTQIYYDGELTPLAAEHKRYFVR